MLKNMSKSLLLFALFTLGCTWVPTSSFLLPLQRSMSFVRVQPRLGRVVMMGAGKKKRKEEKEARKANPSGSSKEDTKRALFEAECLVQGLMTQCKEKRRDLDAIARTVDGLRTLSSSLKPAQSTSLSKDWRLFFVSSDDALSAMGTGLHKLPLTRMEDFFLSISGSGATGRRIEVVEVMRILGPFPNVRNTLKGMCKGVGPNSLSIKYTSMVDGTGKEVKSGKGELDRDFEVDVAFAGMDVMVMALKGKGEGDSARGGNWGQLVFRREPDISDALAKLRVD
ncbi:unnamed protein product [Choristocarpus tenellus]